MAQRLFITTPIYYVNAEPHIGHAYTTIAADVLARFHRSVGDDVFFLTGTDEHGTHVAEAARKLGLSPQAHTDRVSALYRKNWKALAIKEDYFIRTTDQRHHLAVAKFLQKLYDSRTPDGQRVIYEGQYKGLYCIGCEKFLTEKDLTDGKCPNHLTVPQVVSEKNYFFRLSAYLVILERLIQNDQICIRPEERKRETLGLFKQGLEDFSLSREKETWGIPLPFDPAQTTYVWVDALLNYISAVGYGDNEKQFSDWWSNSKVIHLMGKDILKFHTIYWPAMLLAADLKPPDLMFIHGYFTINGQKMSKSLGNFIEPKDMLESFGTDGTRYLLLTQFPLGQDGDVQAERFVEKYNADLANDFGNLASRIFKLVTTHFDGKIPQPSDLYLPDQEFQQNVIALARAAYMTYAGLARHNAQYVFNDAIETVGEIVKVANRYFESAAPWNWAKAGDYGRLATILYSALECLRIISELYYPLLPERCKYLRKALGFTEPEKFRVLENPEWGLLKAGINIHLDTALFPRLEQSKASSDTGQKATLTIEDFAKLDLRIAKVLKAERVPGADKLLQLQIDADGERRQIVAGIAHHYAPEALVGKNIVVVWNLRPAKIRGINSQGMLLAARAQLPTGEKLVLVTVDSDIPSGAKIS